MEGLPYEYRMLPRLKTDDYVVFHVSNPRQDLGINVAFGLPNRKNRCQEPPQLPAPHRSSSRAFSGAAGHPLICIQDDGWRVGDSPRESVLRAQMGGQSLAMALCEEVYDKERFEDFVCFD